MVKVTEFRLDAESILDAAIEILRERGLDAVSMRSVAGRLGVSPVPLYSRVGNKDALLDAVAERLLHDLAPTASADEPWSSYALRWARELRSRLRQAPDARLILGARRWACVEASRPLIGVMRSSGFAPDSAVRACRLLMWTTVGFVAMEGGPTLADSVTARRRLAGGDPAGVTQERRRRTLRHSSSIRGRRNLARLRSRRPTAIVTARQLGFMPQTFSKYASTLSLAAL